MEIKTEVDFIPFNSSKLMPQGRSLVFAPHPDDEVFGCGGAIIRHIQQGDEVKVIIITDGAFQGKDHKHSPSYAQIRKNESIDAAKILGYGVPEFLEFPDRGLHNVDTLITELGDIIQQNQSQNIYMPAKSEIHPDHITTYTALIEAARRYEKDLRLFCYEIGYPLEPNLLHDITDIHPQLEKAMDCFISQRENQDYKRHITALHTYRSYTLGKKVRFAEAYYLFNSSELKPGDTLWKDKAKELAQIELAKSGAQDYPLISVIVRTMNTFPLYEALESIAKQTYPNIEVIVVDACGKESLDLGKTCGKFPLRLISKGRPLNRPEAANTGLEVIKGEFFSFLDEDDLILPEHIENLYNCLKNSNAPAAYDVIKQIKTKTTAIYYKSPFDYLKLFWGNYIPNMALLYHSSIISKGVKFDESLQVYEDWDFVLQAANHGNFIFLPEKGGIYRDENSSGVQNNREMIRRSRKIIYEKWIPTLNQMQITELLLKLDFLDINELEQFRELKESKNRLKKNYNNIQKLNEVLKTDLKQQLETTKVLKEKNSQIEQHFNLISAQIQQKDIELNKQKHHYDFTIQKIQVSKSYKFALFLRNVANSFYPYLFAKKILKKHYKLKHEKLLSKCRLFDSEYYIKNNPDVKAAGVNPVSHYLVFGGFEGRNPSKQFNSAFYIDQNPDVKASHCNPLLHYIKYGRHEGRKALPSKRLKNHITFKTGTEAQYPAIINNEMKLPFKQPHFKPPVDDYSLLVPFDYKIGKIEPEPSIAVVCHLFYTDLTEDIKNALRNIPFSFDLFITTNTIEKKKEIKHIFSDWSPRQINVKVVHNRGRDIAPKLLAWPNVYGEYEFFLHIHTKKTVQEKVLCEWREYLYETLLGSEETVKSIFDAFKSDSSLGIIAPQHFQSIRHAIGWGWNFDEAKTFAQKLGIQLNLESQVDFPSGSMFWGRSAALKPLLDSGLTLADFPEESGQIDHTLSHVIERLYLFVCEKAGFHWIKISDKNSNMNDERMIEVISHEMLKELIPLIKGSLLEQQKQKDEKDYLVKTYHRSVKNLESQSDENEIHKTLPLHEKLRYLKIQAHSPYEHIPLNEFIHQLELHIDGKESIIDFDEEFYMKANPDVARVISNGLYKCGFTHFCLSGKKENRLWSNNQIIKYFGLKSSFPDGMVKPINIKPKNRYIPIKKSLRKGNKPLLLILFGHLQRKLFYAGYKAFFKDFESVFSMFDRIVLSVEYRPIEPELAIQYSDKIEVIDKKKLHGIDIQPDLIICFSSQLFAKALKLFSDREKIIYYCQEYEAGFFPYGTEYIEAMKAIAQSRNLIISTIILYNFLKNKGFLSNTRVFVSSPEIETFDVKPDKNNKLFFYFRPEYFHSRNIPEVIWESVEEFCSYHQYYDLYLVGTIDTRFSFELNSNNVFILSKLPRVEYLHLISSCDVVVSMIYSAHPGVIAFQAAASGIPTVTNIFENRDAKYLKQISKNIVPFDPVTEHLTEKIESALRMPKGHKSFNETLYSGCEKRQTLKDFIGEILS